MQRYDFHCNKCEQSTLDAPILPDDPLYKANGDFVEWQRVLAQLEDRDENTRVFVFVRVQ